MNAPHWLTQTRLALLRSDIQGGKKRLSVAVADEFH